jgi:hypothetical protein
MPPNQAQAFAVPTTDIWDVSQVYDTDFRDPGQMQELFVRLYQNLNNMSLSLNARDAGYYDTQQYLNSQVFFPNPALNSSTATTPTYRSVFRKVINFGALPNAASKSALHGIVCSAATSFTRIYGTATDPVGFNYIPLPYASPVLANNIAIDVDATNVTITTGSNRTAFTITYVVLEYLQT